MAAAAGRAARRLLIDSTCLSEAGGGCFAFCSSLENCVNGAFGDLGMAVFRTNVWRDRMGWDGMPCFVNTAKSKCAFILVVWKACMMGIRLAIFVMAVRGEGGVEDNLTTYL